MGSCNWIGSQHLKPGSLMLSGSAGTLALLSLVLYSGSCKMSRTENRELRNGLLSLQGLMYYFCLVFGFPQRFRMVGSLLFWQLEAIQAPPLQNSMDKSPLRTCGAVPMLQSGDTTSGFTPTRRASSWASPPSPSL